ncbi:MAG: VTT domain-containing protein [Planctomycetia bacterium]|nr:VTT domain-containing protein [Planctomycetia bacterium]
MKCPRLVWLIFLLVLLPLIPFLLWNEPLEAGCRAWLENYGTRPVVVSAMAVTLLTVDLFLPVPSSVVSVLLARSLSTYLTPSWLGLLVACGVLWLGMTCGALLAWILGKLGGETLARKLSGEEEFEKMRAFNERHGGWILVLLRAVPLFAEASVLCLSVSGVRFWRVFFLPVALSNLGIAVVYCVLGSSDNGLPLGAVVTASIALPALVTGLAKRFHP